VTNGRLTALVIAGLVLVALGLSAFTVNERELAIKLQMGRVVQAHYEPGLHFKIPFVQTVEKFPRRLLTIGDDPERIFTRERIALDVDFFVKWRITDAVQYYISTRGDEETARDRLAQIVRDSIVTEMGKRTVQEAVSVERAELMRDMLATASATAEGLGIDLVDVRVKQVEFPADVRESVYNRMREERKRVAEQSRAEGREIAEERKARADRERAVILAEANQRAQEIRGEGDARAAAIYAAAYGKDPEFYAFYRSINAYMESLGDPSDVVVVEPDNEFFRYLNRSGSGQ
jgi:membrane protease subunit HflC